MKFRFCSTAVLLSSVMIAGCAWNGEIAKDFHSPFGSKADSIPVTIGIIVDPKFAPADVEYGASMSYRLRITNYLYGLQTELGHHFQDVQLVKDMDDCPSCSLFALPQASVILDQYSGIASGAMRVQFFNPKGQKVTQLTSSQQTGGVLGTSIGSPSSYGKKITSATERVLSMILSDMCQKISKDPFLSERALVPPKVNVDKSKLQIDDKYKKYLSAVTVIRTPDGSGSGFFINKNTLITNEHVVSNWANVSLTLVDGKQLMGTVIAVDPLRDLAIVKSDEANKAVLELGNEADNFIGEEVVAIGAPMDLDWTITKGVISQSRKLKGVDHIQTDTHINPGNSGGPLISVKTGKIVGVNVSTRRLDGNFPLEGLNFAVSVDELKDFLKEKGIKY